MPPTPEQIALYLSVNDPTSQAYYTQQERENKRFWHSAKNVALLGGGFYVGNKLLNVRMSTLHNFVPAFIGKRLGTVGSLPALSSEINPQITFVKDPITGIGHYINPPNAHPWGKVLGAKEFAPGQFDVTGKHYLFDMVRRIEDHIGGIPRTFQVSSLLSPGLFKNTTHTIPGNQAGELYSYLRAAFPNAKDLNYNDLVRHGLNYKNGTLTVGGQVISTDASLMIHDIAEEGVEHQATRMRSQLARARQAAYGVKPYSGKQVLAFLPVSNKPLEKISTLGRLLKGDFSGTLRTIEQTRLGNAAGGMINLGVSRYLGLLDAPAKVLEEVGGTVHPSIGKAWEKYGAANLFGSQGIRNTTTSRLLKRHFLYGLPLAVGLYTAYKEADSFAKRSKVLDYTALAEGVPGAGAELAKKLDLSYSRFSELTGMTNLAEWQEKKLNERVGLLNLAGVPAGLAFGGALGTYSIGRALAKRGARGGPAGKIAAAEWAAKDMAPALEKLGSLGKGVGGLAAKRGISLTPTKLGAIAGALLGVALVAPLIPGALGSRDRPEELRKEYAGVKDTVIRKGRNWLFGRTPLTGSRGSMIVPNYYNRMILDAKEEQLYPEEYRNKPIKRFLKGLVDPHWLAKLHYYDRPTPTDTASGDLSQAWALTIGRILKPPVIMHAEELTGGKGLDEQQIVAPSLRPEETWSEALGGAPQEKALPQFGAKYQSMQFAERWLRTKPGILGYGLASIKSAITGSPMVFDEESYFSNFSDVTGKGRTFWENEMGDPGGYTEGFRRIFLPKRFPVEYRNPLLNLSPSWLPGPGDKSVNFQAGDPYSAVPLGELRLPGAGFAKRYPELKGVQAEDYPDIYRYKVLSDVSPYSSQFKLYRERLKMQQRKGELSPLHEEMFLETEKIIGERREGVQIEQDADSTLGKYWQGLRSAMRRLPTEFISPLAPAHKLMGRVDAVESYKESMLAPEFAPWNNPIESFIKPTARMTLDTLSLGNYPIPENIEDQRNFDEYFDKLAYLKNQYLGNMAAAAGRTDLQAKFIENSRRTTFGVDSYGPIDTIYGSVPSREREYLAAFTGETNVEKRQAIRELVPESMQRIYNSQWERNDALAPMEGTGASDLEAMARLNEIRGFQGFDTSTGIVAMAKSAVESEVTGKRPDIRNAIRQEVLAGYFADKNLPPPNYIGFSPSVNLDDIKLKMIDNMGENIHDYNMWETQQREVWRKPYVESAANEVEAWNSSQNNRLGVRQQIKHMLSSYGTRNVEVYVDDLPGGWRNQVSTDLEQDRTSDVASLLQEQRLIR